VLFYQKELVLLIRETATEISKFPDNIDSMDDLKKKKALAAQLDEYTDGLLL